MNFGRTLAAIVAAIVPLAALPVVAQIPSHQQVAAADIAHAQRMMPVIDAFLSDHPDNADALYAKARASMSLGLYEDARNAYLRLMPQLPNHPVLILELATVEHRLRNYEAARTGYQQVAAMPNLPVNVATTIDTRLAQVDQALQRHFFSGSVTVGLRAQENANGGPDSRFIDFWGESFQMDEDSRPRADETATISGRFGYSYKLNDQGDTLGAQISTFTMQPSHIDENQRDGVELRFGPTMSLSRFDMNGTLSAHGLLSRTWVEGDAYMEGKGLHLAYNTVLDPDNRISVTFGHRNETYAPSESRTRAADRNGHRNEFGVTWQHLIRPDLMLSASYGHEDRNTAVAHHASRTDRFSLTLAHQYASPVSWSEGSWSTSARLGLKSARFDAADPMLNPDEVEQTRDVSISLTQSVPLHEKINASLSLAAVRASSNYATSEWSDTSVDVSITYSF